MANQAINELRNDLGSEYNDFTDEQLAQALHHQYQQDTGDTVDFQVFADEIGFSSFNPPESSDSLRSTDAATMQPATAGEKAAPDVSQKIGMSASEFMDANTYEDPWTTVLQKDIQRIPERAKQLGGALIDVMAPAIDPLFQGEFQREDKPSITREVSQEVWKQADEKIKALQPKLKHGTPKWYASAIFNATADMGFAVAASAITKNPNIGLAVMTSQVFVDKKAQSLSEGKSEERANLDAVFYAMTEGFSEKVPLGILTKEGGKWLNRTFKSMGAEGLQEVFAEAAQIGYERGIFDEGQELTFSQMARQLWDAGVIGMGTGGTLAVVTQPFTDSPEKALGREMLAMVEQVNLAVDNLDTVAKFSPPQNNAQAAFQEAVKETPVIEQPPEYKPEEIPPEKEAVIPEEVPPQEVESESPAPIEEVAKEEKPAVKYHSTIDTRFPEYEPALEDMAASLQIGGDIQVVDDPNYKPGESDKPGEAPKIRTPSVNPTWYQAMADELKVTVKEVKYAVDRAKKGKRLGSRQAQIVSTMIDELVDPDQVTQETAAETKKTDIPLSFTVGEDEYYTTESGKKYKNNTPISDNEYNQAFSTPEKKPKVKSATKKKGIETIYRGEMAGQTKEGSFYSGSADFAKEFTQSGQENEIKQARINNSDIFEPETEVFAGDVAKVDAELAEAKKQGFKAVRLSEGKNQPKSIFVFDDSALITATPETPKAAEPAKKVAPSKPKKPRGNVQSSRAGDIQSVWAPGDTYVPMLRGQPITDIEIEAAKVPDKPIRREHIIKKMERLFGVKIYKGRVKGKTRLGFFRASNSELRTKYHNDLEVTAHEVTHWLDDRYPAFARAYRRKPFKQELIGISYDVGNIKEGFAEFGRLYMTQESEAVLRAPLFYDKFVEIMQSEGIQTNVDDIKDSMHQWYNQGALDRFRSKIGKDSEPIRQRIATAVDGFSDKAIAAVFDGLHGLKVAEADLTGNIATADLSPYKSVRLLGGSRGVTKTVLEHGTIDYDSNGDIIFTGKGLRQVFEPVAEVFDDTMLYFAARRASELMKQGREHHFEDAEIKAALKLADENPVMKEVFDEYQAFNKRMMDFYQHSGLLNKESRKAMEEMNKDYVPFFRIQEEITGEFSTKRTPFKRLTGGTANVDDIFDNITFGTATLVHQALLNRAKQRAYRMLDHAAGGAKYAVKIPTDIKMTDIERVQVEDAFLKGIGMDPKAYRQSQKMHMSNPAIDGILEMLSTNLGDFVGFFTFGHAPQGNNIDSVMIDGKRVFYEVGDPLFMQAMNALGSKPVHLALRIGAGFKNTLTRGVTSMPDFQMVNLLRDSFNGFALSQGGMIPVIDSVKGFKNKLLKDDIYWEFMANGGGFSSTVHGETQATRRHLERLYGNHGIDYKTVLDTPQKMMDMWDEMTSAFEYGTRLAEYKANRKKGKSMQESAYQGREVSTDFAMRGYSQFLRVFTTTVPFLNARMQGLYKLEREAFEKGGKQTPFGENAARLAVRGLGALTIPSLMLYLLNRDDERYKALPEWVKDLHWVILIPGKEDAYLIPKPFEVGAMFATIPERMLQLYIEQNGDKFGDSMFRIFKDTFNLDPTPQIIKPWLETEAFNRKFTGAPIVPEDLQGIESWEQYRPYTAQSMVELGKATGMSPLKMEHWVRGYFGTLGMYLLMGSDGLISDGFGGEEPTKRIDQTPIIRRFIRKTPYRNTSYSDQFYEVAEETRKITKTFNKIKKEGRGEDLNQYLGEKNRELMFGLDAAVSDFQGAITEINGAMKRIQLDKNKTGDQKQKEIDAMLKTKNQIFKAASETLAPDKIKQLKRRVKEFE